MDWEGTFDTDTIRDLTDGKGFANAIALATNYDALENLKT